MQIHSIYGAEKDIVYLLQTVFSIMSFVIASACRRRCLNIKKVSLFIILLHFFSISFSTAKVRKRFCLLLICVAFFVNYTKEMKKLDVNGLFVVIYYWVVSVLVSVIVIVFVAMVGFVA